MTADTHTTPFERPDDIWLLNLGYVSEHAEQNLMLYGYIACPGVVNVELMLDVDHLQVQYAVVLDSKALRLYNLQRWLMTFGGVWGKLILLLFLKWFGSYDPARRIAKCIKDYAGPTWKVQVEVIGAKRYLEAANEGRAKGWLFKAGIDESPGAPGPSGTPASTSARVGEDVRGIPGGQQLSGSGQAVP